MNLDHILLILAVYVLACARLTRLVNADTILDPIRVRITQASRNPDASDAEKRRWATFDYWLSCPWCVGFWICLACAYLPTHLIGWPWWAIFPTALAASHLIGVAAALADTEDIEVTNQ